MIEIGLLDIYPFFNLFSRENLKHKTMVNTQQAQTQLDELKFGVIGLFKMRNSDHFELVTDVNDNDTIDVIRFTQFGVIQQEFNLPIQRGTLKLFPYGFDMIAMLDMPFEWSEFIKSFD